VNAHPTRRAVLFAAALTTLWHRAGWGQESGRTYRLGILSSGATRQAPGWVVFFDYRWAEADDTCQPGLAAELVGLPVDLILTWGTAAALASKRATATIPIVMGSVGDPVKAGIVSSLARPGGNVTGFSSQSLELEGKRFAIMRDLLPGIAQIVMLGNTPNTYIDLAMESVERLVTAAGLKFDGVKIDSGKGLGAGLDVVGKAHPDAVLVAAATAFFDDLFRQAAGYVDKILRGASPGELPVQQATIFRLLVNLTAAKALGLTIPPAILARAEVIE